jgi:hypothetical protein
VLRTLAFGDLEAGVWGIMLAGERSFMAIGASAEPQSVPRFTVEGTGDGEDWRISGGGVELFVSGAGEPARGAAPDRFDQLCRVRGRLVLDRDEHEHELDSLGVRGSRDEGQLNQSDSVREVWAWFEPDEGVAVLALRPPKAAGHGTDAVTAAVLDPEGPITVAEPRLSTTYTAGEFPSRMGLELWIGEHESEQYPRRFAGEAVGPRIAAPHDGFAISAALLRCHSRGLDGAGVYLLARRA